ncbi:AraC family transcriptional regulator [Paenibacillus sanguinis]|uniref:AraC family transcriptional regulator n=1 Tax=Paenibacillus sanguinis TaxID=225906 RepID=UPI000366913E|nr:AraC family transcriptional regulator [Paenibacillus sanguinis]
MKFRWPWLNSFRKHPTYMRIIFYFVSVNVLVLAISFLVLYWQSSRTLVEEIGEHSESLLINGAQNTARLLEWSLDFAFSSSNDNDLKVYALSDKYSDYETYKVWSRLMSIKMSNPSIDSVYLINDYTDTVIDSKLGLNEAADFYDQDILQRLRNPRQADQTVLIPRKLPVPLRTDTYKDVITMIRLYEKGNSISAFVLNVDTLELMTLLQSNSQYQNRNIAVLNDHDELVFSSVPLDQQQIREYRSRIRGTSGWEMFKPAQQEAQLMVFSNTAVKGIQNWSFIETIPRDVILRKIEVLRNLSMILFSGLFFASLTVTVLISKRVYSPIQDLVRSVMKQHQVESSAQEKSADELDYLSSVFTAQQEQIIELTAHWRNSKVLGRERFLRELLERGLLSRGEIQGQFAEWGVELPEKYLSIALFRIDRFQEFTNRYAEKDRRLLRFAMGNIVHESLKLSGQLAQTVDMGNDHVAVILSASREAAQFTAELKNAQQLVKQYLSLGTTVAWGGEVERFSDLHEAYMETYELSQERFRLGYESIIIRSPSSVTVSGEVYHLPIDKERQLAQAIHKTDGDLALAIIQQAVEALRSLPYFESKMSLITLFMDVRRLLQDQAAEPLPSSFGLTSVENQIIQLETLDRVVPWMEQLLVKALEELAAARSQSKHAGFVQEVERIITEQLSNPNLSSKMLADELGLSVNYLRSLYKAETSQSITDTISKKRLECICRELLTSDSPIEPIISSYGFSSLNTFYSAFKKVYGITPAQYRKMYRSE